MVRSPEVEAFMDALQHPMAAQVGKLRAAIVGIDPRVNESIKWNAPSFFIDDHFATFNLHYPDRIQVVLHAGAKVNPDAKQLEISDPAGLLKWAAVDRATITFTGDIDIDDQLVTFLDVLRQWISVAQ